MPDNVITEKEKKEQIKLLQKYLRTIALNDTRIPIVGIDGIFEEKTGKAVSAFQEIFLLPITGEVDEPTFNKIFDEYIKIVGKPRTCTYIDLISRPDATLEIGQNGITIYFVQVMLLRLADKFSNFKQVPVSGTVDQSTANALDEVRRVSGIDKNASDKDTLTELITIFCALS